MTILSHASTRFNYIRFWNNSWVLYKKFNYIFMTFTEKIFARFLRLLFRLSKFLNASLIYSNVKILRTINTLHVFILFFDNLTFQLKSDYENKDKRYFFQTNNNLDCLTGRIHKTKGFLNLSFLSSFFSERFARKKIILGFSALVEKLSKRHFRLQRFKRLLLFSNLFFYSVPFINLSDSRKNITSLSIRNFLKHLQVFAVRKRLYYNIYSFFNDERGERTLIKLKRSAKPNLLSGKNLSFVSYAAFLFDLLNRFHKVINFNVNLKFVNLRKFIRPVELFTHLIAQRICLLGRPRDRRNKINTSFFIPIFNYMRQDKSIAGFRLMVAGRINRRGRAMWKRFNYGRIPRGAFKLGVEFASQAIKTTNGVLTIKVFLFRPIQRFITEIRHADYMLLSPYLFLNRVLFSKPFSVLKEDFFGFNKFKKFSFLKDRLNYKRRKKKMSKQLMKRSGFSLL